MIAKYVRRPFVAFLDRNDAGRALVDLIRPAPDPGAVVLALPRGGVPVGVPLAAALGCPLSVVVTRKLPIPWSPEIGFGAVAADASVMLNDPLVRQLGLTRSEVDEIVAAVEAEVRRRERAYTGRDGPPEVEGRRVWLVDDGLATGYTAIAAARMIRKQGPESLALCVPVSPVGSIELAEPYVDDLHCLVAQEESPFAVASYYADFHEMTDEEVRGILERSKTAGEG